MNKIQHNFYTVIIDCLEMSLRGSLMIVVAAAIPAKLME